MSLAIGVGFVTAYPVNWWLVRKGLKHGLMTVRPSEPSEEPAGREREDRKQPAPASPVPSRVPHTAHLTTLEA
jgi:manganese oxidase